MVRVAAWNWQSYNNCCCDVSWSHLGHLALGAEEGVALELPRPRLGLGDEGEHVVPGRVRHAVRDPDNIDHIDNTNTHPFTDVLCLFTNGLWVGNLNKKAC